MYIFFKKNLKYWLNDFELILHETMNVRWRFASHAAAGSTREDLKLNLENFPEKS